ncbi:unnamed protein product [Ectocarpus sp. 13 AM-2016]
MELLSQGAEARVFATTFCGRPAVVKERFRKTYRLPALDEKLTTRRTLQEARCMLKARKAGVRTPCLYQLDSANTKITMEKVEGITAKQFLLDCLQRGDSAAALKVAGEIGKMVAKMHDAQVVHGDLTTSNFMVRSGPGEGDVVAIDFGLASSKPLPEDKAVDLYVLERAFISTHENADPLVNEVMRAYKAASRKADATLHKLSEVRRRGRKREMFG